MMAITINERLKVLRKNLDKSQREMSEILDVKASYYSDVENGRRPVTGKFIEKLKSAFNISTDWMYSGNGEMYPKNVSLGVPFTNAIEKGVFLKKEIEYQYVNETSIVLIDQLIESHIQMIRFYCIDLLGQIYTSEKVDLKDAEPIEKYVHDLEGYIESIRGLNVYKQPDYKEYTLDDKIILLNQLSERLHHSLDVLFDLGRKYR